MNEKKIVIADQANLKMKTKIVCSPTPFTLAILLASLLAGYSQAPNHSAVQPVPRPDKSWKDRHESFNKRVAEVGEKAQVIFIGDSITQAWEGEGKEVWARYYTHR